MKANSSAEKTKVTFQVTTDLEQKAKRAAVREDRSLSAYLRRALRNALAAEGELEGGDGRREAAAA